MITEDYVSFETAKLLKEKGMNKSCFKHYVQKNNNDGTSEAVTVCTLQIAMKWLREVYDIYIMIDKDFATENGWHYVVVRKQDWVNNIDNGLIQQESNNYTYETACEAAIKYCLENLI